MPIWHIYIVECSDGTLYTGIAKDVDGRVKRHNSGKGARYTRGRRPVAMVYRERVGDHGDALRREQQIRKKGLKYKQTLITKFGQ